jgi:hypothetical protein
MDPIMRILNFAWDGLLFIKPENLTKTELVEKFKELSSSKSLKDLNEAKKDEDKKDEDKITFKEYLKSKYLRLSAFIIKYKNLISFMNKIALFTILMKYFRKIKLLRFLFRIINYIFLSTFGIFISDIYGLKEIILQIEYYWMNYVNFIHENKIYKILVKIFNVVNDENKSDVIKDNSEVIENKSEVIGDKSNNDSKINNSELPSSGRTFSKEKINDDKISTGDEKENWFDVNKYGLSILCLTLTLILSYIYWDSINELFKNVKPDDSSSDGSNTPVYLDPQEEYRRYFREIETSQELYDLDVIKYQSKGKIIDYSDVEEIKWNDSPTTPKPSTSKLPDTHGVMLPISRK